MKLPINSNDDDFQLHYILSVVMK